MASGLQSLLEQRVCVLTFDGRLFMGTLIAFDQSTNLVLNKCTEKVVHEDAPVEIVPLGLYLLRGDNIAVVGQVDEDVEKSIDASGVRAPPLKPVSTQALLSNAH
ncbi:U6 snRNA-associated Sm-like protein LSm8 [Cyclospora cayetanensis]|uniref:U6 snRNA-associated Sm-like protein LSm8 n=2 Tax=Cyclospora cayetanensis TaxID=88456 RepID=A0A1D3D5N4_9EIME|nr:U6 snRNA-associated Sm-like protein LSm8 [Cyclospora cayetanensis]OEH78751.1 small nuclear protein [Cyclospora cayetanensis]